MMMDAGTYERLARLRYKNKVRLARRDYELDEARYEYLVRSYRIESGEDGGIAGIYRSERTDSAERRYRLAVILHVEARSLAEWICKTMAAALDWDITQDGGVGYVGVGWGHLAQSEQHEP